MMAKHALVELYYMHCFGWNKYIISYHIVVDTWNPDPNEFTTNISSDFPCIVALCLEFSKVDAGILIQKEDEYEYAPDTSRRFAASMKTNSC